MSRERLTWKAKSGTCVGKGLNAPALPGRTWNISSSKSLGSFMKPLRNILFLVSCEITLAIVHG